MGHPENIVEEIPGKDEREETEGKETILVVEDNYQMLDYIKSHLIGQYKIATSPDGKKGFENSGC